jgi:ABC-2 type transport system ATP-binding protein
MPIIDVRDLVKVYPGDVRAVDGVSLAVEEGEILGFLGPNGAGKTTTIRIMTTLLAPTSGSVRVAGHDVVHDPAAVRSSIGVALQEAGLDLLQTGREFLVLQASLYAVADPRRRAAELIEVVGLEDAADRRLATYSGGMRRRLDLAAALVHRPSLLFLDEPTTGLDPASREAVWDEIRRMNRAGTTVFLTTQYMEEADVLAERLAIIDAGRIVLEGTPDELKASIAEDVVRVAVRDHDREAARAAVEDQEGVARVEHDEDGLAVYVRNGAQAIAPMVRALDEAEVDLIEVALTRPTLDDVFLRATGYRLEGAEGRGGDAWAEGRGGDA